MALKSIVPRDASAAPNPAAPEETFKGIVAPTQVSEQAKEHLGRIDRIAADVLRDLDAVSEEIGKLRDEITLRARMLGEATVEFDELARTASQGYGSIRKAIDMVRQKFAAGAKPTPTLPAPDSPEQNGRPNLVPDVP
jgi:hypothetical protein